MPDPVSLTQIFKVVSLSSFKLNIMLPPDLVNLREFPIKFIIT